MSGEPFLPTPRWSVGSDVARSAAMIAELPVGRAIVGVLPGGLRVKDNNPGSVVLTTLGHAETGAPEPLFTIRFPAPEVVTEPRRKHSFAPFPAIIVF